MSRDVYKQSPADRSGRTIGNRPGAPHPMTIRTAIVALGVCAGTLAGCAAAPPGLDASPTPVALSVPAYQGILRSANSATAAALDSFATAGSPEDARTQLDQASAAVLEAARLLEVDPPVAALAVHRDLVAGLRQLAADLSQLSGQAAAMDLCAAPSILPTLSDAPGVNSLRLVREALGSGRGGTSYLWGESLPAHTPLPDRRLANGQLVDSVRRSGMGELKVENGSDHDAVFKLVQDGKPIVSVYVGSGSNTIVKNIDDGTYEMFYTTGVDWDNQLKMFTRSCTFKRFGATAEFTTTRTQYSIETIGIQPRTGANTRSIPVPGQSFPR